MLFPNKCLISEMPKDSNTTDITSANNPSIGRLKNTDGDAGNSFEMVRIRLHICKWVLILANLVILTFLMSTYNKDLHCIIRDTNCFHLFKPLQHMKFSVQGFYLKSFLYYVPSGISRVASRSLSSYFSFEKSYWGFYFCVTSPDVQTI